MSKYRANVRYTEPWTERIRRSQVIYTDDTVVPIQSPGAKQCRQGRIWCYLGDKANPYTVYNYTPILSRDGLSKWLSGYEGYLQADAQTGGHRPQELALRQQRCCGGESCEAVVADRQLRTPHDVDPQRYLTSVLAKIGTTPRDELQKFLPDVWKRDDAAEKPFVEAQHSRI